MKNIFITGESGTIPLAIQEYCTYYDFNIVNSQIYDIYNLNNLKRHQSFQVRKPELDFLDKKLFNDLDIFNKVDYIIHSGAFVGTDFCESKPQDAIKTNVEGTFNIVQIANKYKIPLIYFSTTAIFNPEKYDIKNPITEKTEIKPQTLYGITKYAGEQIVQKLCKTPYLIIRPVFGFGNYPEDLHSALTKYIYISHYNSLNENKKNLKILLDFNIKKSYTRVENIANIVLSLIINKNTNWCDDYNVGENFSEGKDWNELVHIINKFIAIDNKNIEFISSMDYLHSHLINDYKINSIGCNFNNLKNYIDIEKGIEMTINSVKEQIEKEPYWLQ